ncbi:MAG TPA: biotin/lipoyl-containing protein, partial [Actinomycetota bacterium]|nr:biotin/lipoyl-containing protein [Actinomycetota bacterium]
MPDFKLPDLGEGMTEAEIDRWLVKEGDVVAEDDPLVELITDKATAEIPSPFAGTVTKIHAEPGAVVPVGSVLITISDGADGGAADAGDASVPVLGTPAASSEPPMAPTGSSPPPATTGRTPNMPESSTPTAAPSESSSTHSVPTLAEGPSSTEAVQAMPPVRKLAASLGVDLSQVRGTGASGQI